MVATTFTISVSWDNLFSIDHIKMQFAQQQQIYRRDTSDPRRV